MPSSNIVRDTRALIQNKLLPTVSPKWLPKFQFGLEAFCLRPFQSANSNARSVITNTNTAASKTLRLFRNLALAEQLGSVFDALSLVHRGDYVNVDHSDQDGLTALVGARQTGNGRAIPCFVETTYAHHIPNDSDQPRWQRLRTAMIVARKSQDFADRLGFWPKLVFNRGFGNESLVTHLAAEGCTFYVRLKAGSYIELDGQKISVNGLAKRQPGLHCLG